MILMWKVQTYTFFVKNLFKRLLILKQSLSTHFKELDITPRTKKKLLKYPKRCVIIKLILPAFQVCIWWNLNLTMCIIY